MKITSLTGVVATDHVFFLFVFFSVNHIAVIYKYDGIVSIYCLQYSCGGGSPALSVFEWLQARKNHGSEL